MNLLENYIIDIIDKKEVKDEYGTYLKVTVKTKCYGVIETQIIDVASERELNILKEKGYFLS